MHMTPNKPYFIRAIYDWIIDNDATPYMLVDATMPMVEVPQAFVNNGQIILDISPSASRGLHLGNDRIIFTAKFSGISTQIVIHPAAVMAIYAQENGRGMEFGPEFNKGFSFEETSNPAPMPTQLKSNDRKRPFLKLVDLDEKDKGD
ncbi:ClpXP protease specificity-enhancing factor [Legionella sp. W05-934-2]|jgi:stringent starvation protein B|uniref:ClpXP protease specificity-enhancing factor n=1 Tax=Legionella sp. W05-934-2 TaxID=1198649 RepID=UPI0034635F38